MAMFDWMVPNAAGDTNKTINDKYGSMRGPDGSIDLSKATPSTLQGVGFDPMVAEQIAQNAQALRMRQEIMGGAYQAPSLSMSDKIFGGLQVVGDTIHRIQSPGRGALPTGIYDSYYDTKDKMSKAAADEKASVGRDFATGASDAVSQYIKVKRERQMKAREAVISAQALGLPVTPEMLKEAGLDAPSSSPVSSQGAAQGAPQAAPQGMAPASPPQGGPPAMGAPPMPQELPQGAPPMRQPQGGAPTGDANLVRKFDTEGDPEISRLTQLLDRAVKANAMGQVDDKAVDNIRAQLDLAIKTREQMTKRQEIDPAKKAALKSAEVNAQVEAERSQAGKQMGITAQGVGSTLASLESLPDTTKGFDGVTGAYDSLNPLGLRDMFGDAKNNEVRDRINGDLQSVLAVMKTFVRKPGEGTWTDADQAQLEQQAGKILNARDGAEYKRRIQALRDRISSTFTRPYGVEIPGSTPQRTSVPPGPAPGSMPGAQGGAPGPAPAPQMQVGPGRSAMASPSAPPSEQLDVLTPEQAAQMPKGTRFLTTDGRPMVVR